MLINTIYSPIKDDMSKVRSNLTDFIDNQDPSVKHLFEHFFKKTGKLFRPSLVFFAAGVINQKAPLNADDNLIQLAYSMELLHSASLIHDDIIDDDLIRRGQNTLNKEFNNKIAVLTGDILFSHTFSIIGILFPKDYIKTIVDFTIKMCMAEILQTKVDLTYKEYFKVIEGKTALFISICCKLGAKYAGAMQKEIDAMENYGLYFGLAYQIKDDLMDDDINAKKYVTDKDVERYFNMAIDSLKSIKDSIYKNNLLSLIDYFLKEIYK